MEPIELDTINTDFTNGTQDQTTVEYHYDDDIIRVSGSNSEAINIYSKTQWTLVKAAIDRHFNRGNVKK